MRISCVIISGIARLVVVASVWVEEVCNGDNLNDEDKLCNY